MSAEVVVSWECDWCRTRSSCHEVNKLPFGWHEVLLPGLNYRPDRHLCHKCARLFYEREAEFRQVAEAFWLRVHHSIPDAPDAKPLPDLD